MNISILLNFIMALCFGTAFASVGLEIVEPVEGHHDQCFVKENNAFYKINENWNLKECGVGSCSSINIRGKQKFIISYTGCGVMQAELPCYVSENNDLVYPDCCPQVICPEFQETEQNDNGLMEDNNSDDDDDYNSVDTTDFGQRKSRDDAGYYGYGTKSSEEYTDY